MQKARSCDLHTERFVAGGCTGNLYVVDSGNHRVLRFAPGARSGVVVAGGHGEGSALSSRQHRWESLAQDSARYGISARFQPTLPEKIRDREPRFAIVSFTVLYGEREDERQRAPAAFEPRAPRAPRGRLAAHRRRGQPPRRALVAGGHGGRGDLQRIWHRRRKKKKVKS